MVSDRFVYPVTRLAAVDADGKNLRVLIQNSREAQGQYQDEIVNWTPGKPDTVLIEADEGMSANDLATGVEVYGDVGTHALPAVFELNVISGQMSISPARARPDPSLGYRQARSGQTRLGYFGNLDLLLGSSRRRIELAPSEQIRDIQPRKSFRAHRNQRRRSQCGLCDRPFRRPKRHLAHRLDG
jgi:hypothetical protein